MADAHPLFTLTGRTALVTGATQGIGRATVGLLLELGARVLAVARTAPDLEARHREWSALGEAHVLAADLATEAGRAATIAEVGARFGESLDVLVNNVGTNIRKPVDDYPLTDVQRLMAVNVESAYGLAQGLRELLMDSAGGGCVVNVSSVASVNVVGTSTVGYAMSKGALDNLTKWLAVAWGRRGVRVNAVLPWYTRTELTAELLERAELRGAVEAVTPLGRVAEAREVAAAIAMLCMPGASYINGATLAVDGGYLVRGIGQVGA